MANDVSLDRLPADLRSVSTTPDYAFIAPNLCDNGTEFPCVDGRPRHRGVPARVGAAHPGLARVQA
jgi:hypothetical protein